MTTDFSLHQSAVDGLYEAFKKHGTMPSLSNSIDKTFIALKESGFFQKENLSPSSYKKCFDWLYANYEPYFDLCASRYPDIWTTSTFSALKMPKSGYVKPFLKSEDGSHTLKALGFLESCCSETSKARIAEKHEMDIPSVTALFSLLILPHNPRQYGNISRHGTTPISDTGMLIGLKNTQQIRAAIEAHGKENYPHLCDWFRRINVSDRFITRIAPELFPAFRHIQHHLVSDNPTRPEKARDDKPKTGQSPEGSR